MTAPARPSPPPSRCAALIAVSLVFSAVGHAQKPTEAAPPATPALPTAALPTAALPTEGLTGESERLQSSGQAHLGQPIPWFAGWTANDGVLNRTHILGTPNAKLHAIVFFATWCVPCEPGMRALAARREALSKAGVHLWLVNVGEPPTQVAPYLTARGLDGIPVVFDRFGRVAEAFGAQRRDGDRVVTALPRTALVTPDGILRGVIGKEGADYVPYIKSLVGAKPDPNSPTLRK